MNFSEIPEEICNANPANCATSWDRGLCKLSPELRQFSAEPSSSWPSAEGYIYSWQYAHIIPFFLFGTRQIHPISVPNAQFPHLAIVMRTSVRVWVTYRPRVRVAVSDWVSVSSTQKAPTPIHRIHMATTSADDGLHPSVGAFSWHCNAKPSMVMTSETVSKCVEPSVCVCRRQRGVWVTIVSPAQSTWPRHEPLPIFRQAINPNDNYYSGATGVIKSKSHSQPLA